MLLSSSEWVEDVKDTDPYVSVLSRLGKSIRLYLNNYLLLFIGEAIQESETYMEFVKKSFSIITNTCNVFELNFE